MSQLQVGAHVSASGGIYKAVERAEKIGAEAIQIFGAAPQQWRRKDHGDDISRFRADARAARLGPTFIHAIYLINLASPDDELLAKSIDALTADLRLGSQLGVEGVIVHVGSVSSRYGGLPGDVVYASSKGALDSFTLGLSREVGPEGIRVCCVRPGITRTKIFEASIGIERAEAIAKAQTVLGRICEPEEVANLVVWICTEEASYVTTTIYDIAGGR